MKPSFFLFVCFVAGNALTACGGPSAAVNQTHQGELAASDSRLSTDNSFYDTYEFEANEGDDITITMTSAAFDAYAHLVDRDGNQLAHDDDGAGGTNARVTFRAPYSGRYSAFANSLEAGRTGAYTLQIQTRGNRPQN